MAPRQTRTHHLRLRPLPLAQTRRPPKHRRARLRHAPAHPRHARPQRRPTNRAPRIDEAQAILDIQYPIDDIHPLDRQQRTTIRFYFHPHKKQLTLHPSRHDHELHVVKTKQNLGDRHWWACPTCGQRKKHLYYFIAGHANHTTAPAHVLGCRTCLGLTYASRSQHRCPDHDQHQARNGNLNAAMRTIARIDKKTRGDLATLEAIRKRLHRDARALGVQLPTDSRLAPPARRRR